MSKYDFALDMQADNSNSLILRNIAPNSEVLETACAHGRMTRYLRETLHCRVTIVEYDQDSGAAAAEFAADSRHIGPEQGDLEKGPWYANLKQEGRKFDFVVMADVLEHLHDPATLLTRAKDLLKPGGSIWISVPNFTHNAVLIETLNGRFEYGNIGLLDSTHIHFFSAPSLEAMARRVGLRVVKRLDPVLKVKRVPELQNSYRDVPWYVALYLKLRKGGEIYQFVWELKV